jgi:hypothetical protein
MPDYNPMPQAVMYIQHRDGRVTCKRCAHTWRFVRETKRHRCPNCHRAIYWSPVVEGRCNPARCRYKKCLCRIDPLIWMVERQTWKAVPGKKGLVWKTVSLTPTTRHDLMLKFRSTKEVIGNFLAAEMNRGTLVRRVRVTHPSEEIHEVKQKVYFRNDVKKRCRVTHRQRRPTRYQYFPTHWAMVDFLSRNPDAVDLVKKEVPLWKPLRIQRVKTLVKFTPIILPLTPEEKSQIVSRRLQSMARINRTMGYPLPRL